MANHGQLYERKEDQLTNPQTQENRYPNEEPIYGVHHTLLQRQEIGSSQTSYGHLDIRSDGYTETQTKPEQQIRKSDLMDK